MLRFIISFILILGSIAAALLLEGFNPVNLAAFTALLVVLSIPLFASFGVWKISEVLKAWTDPFVNKKADTFAVSLSILEFQEKLFYLSGAAGTILGFIIVLRTVQTQPIDKVCFGFAASLISLLYGLLLATVMRVLRARIEYTKSR